MATHGMPDQTIIIAPPRGWRGALARWWADPALRRPALLLALGVLASAAAWGGLRGLRAQEAAFGQRMAGLAAQAASVVPVAMPAVQPAADYTQRLPSDFRTHEVVRHLQKVCAAEGVQFVSVGTRSAAAAPDRLGREELRIALRGPYAATKRVLREALARYPHAALASWAMRRNEGADDVLSDVAVLLLAAPLRSPAEAPSVTAAGR
jgi:hypothetical protein